MNSVQLTLDLDTVAGRAAMRAYLDALDEAGGAVNWPAKSPVVGKETTAGVAVAPPAAEMGEAAPCAPVVWNPGADGPGQADTPPSAPTIAEPAPSPVVEPSPDPKRPWTDADKAEAWERHRAGMPPPEVARRLRRDAKQVANYLMNVKTRRSRVPEPPKPAPAPAEKLPALRKPASVAVAVAERRHPATDPAIRSRWRAEMEQRERENAVARAGP